MPTVAAALPHTPAPHPSHASPVLACVPAQDSSRASPYRTQASAQRKRPAQSPLPVTHPAAPFPKPSTLYFLLSTLFSTRRDAAAPPASAPLGDGSRAAARIQSGSGAPHSTKAPALRDGGQERNTLVQRSRATGSLHDQGTPAVRMHDQPPVKGAWSWSPGWLAIRTRRKSYPHHGGRRAEAGLFLETTRTNLSFAERFSAPSVSSAFRKHAWIPPKTIDKRGDRLAGAVPAPHRTPP